MYMNEKVNKLLHVFTQISVLLLPYRYFASIYQMLGNKQSLPSHGSSERLGAGHEITMFLEILVDWCEFQFRPPGAIFKGQICTLILKVIIKIINQAITRYEKNLWPVAAIKSNDLSKLKVLG